MFGVKSSDARLQRAEYLGGSRIPLSISEVLQTSQTSDTPQGNLAGHGYTAGAVNGFTRRFEEHGMVIGILSVLPRTAYMQGIPRFLLKDSRYDFYWPDFAHIGEQEVYSQELYAAGQSVQGVVRDTFGYQSRYSEYRTVLDQVNGEMRTSLKHWNMARHFTQLPYLNESFVESDPTTRIYAVEDPEWHKLICQLYFNFRAIRPVSKFGDPI